MEEPKYTPALNAWYATMLERDKSVLTLAAAGVAGTIAGFIALATSEAIKSPHWMYPGALAALFFVASFWLSLEIFRDNASFLHQVLGSDDESSVELDKASERLKRKKNDATFSLIVGVVFALGMGGLAAIERATVIKVDQAKQLKEENMANQGQNEGQLLQDLLKCNADANARFNRFENMHKLPGPTAAKPVTSSAAQKPVTSATPPLTSQPASEAKNGQTSTTVPPVPK